MKKIIALNNQGCDLTIKSKDQDNLVIPQIKIEKIKKKYKSQIIKVVVLRGENSNASPFLYQYLGHNKKDYDPSTESSQDKDLKVDKGTIQLQFIVTTGQEEYAVMAEQTNNEADIFIAFYQDQSEFDQLKKEINNIKRLHPKKPVVLIYDATKDEGKSKSKSTRGPEFSEEYAIKANLYSFKVNYFDKNTIENTVKPVMKNFARIGYHSIKNLERELEQEQKINTHINEIQTREPEIDKFKYMRRINQKHLNNTFPKDFDKSEARKVSMNQMVITSPNSYIKVLGSTSANTCLIVALWDSKTQITALAHFSTRSKISILDRMSGLDKLLPNFYGPEIEAHLVGGNNGDYESREFCATAIEILRKRNFTIKTCHVLTKSFNTEEIKDNLEKLGTFAIATTGKVYTGINLNDLTGGRSFAETNAFYLKFSSGDPMEIEMLCTQEEPNRKYLL